jgi:hypothetical protein
MQKSDIANNDSLPSFVPLDCPLCGFLFRDFQDCMQYLEAKCCTECWISFLEPIKKLNGDDDYEPSSSEIAGWREKVSSGE